MSSTKSAAQRASLFNELVVIRSPRYTDPSPASNDELDRFLAEGSVRSERVPELVGLRALVADQNLDESRRIAKLLVRLGMRCEWSALGREAAYRAAHALEDGDEFQVFLVAWEAAGEERTIELIKQQVGAGANALFVILSEDEIAADKIAVAGASGCIVKPIDDHKLRSVLVDLIRETGSSTEAEFQPVDFSGRRVLLAEDSALNREVATEILTAAGFMVETAENGRVATRLVSTQEEGHYDVVLMDVQMPVMDGIAATRAIRSLKSAGRASVPIIALTPDDRERNRSLALESGANDHLAKPINIPLLMQTLIKHVG